MAQNYRYLNFTWHPKQRKMFSFATRFMIGHSGRRFGKTIGSQNWLSGETLTSDGEVGWYLAPSKDQAEKGFRSMIKLISNKKDSNLHEFVTDIKESKKRIYLTDGKFLEFKTTERPVNMRGEGVCACVFDEAGYHRDNVWQETVRPMLMDYKARTVFLGTPRSYNWFFRLYNEALKKPELYSIYNYSSYDNPFIDHEEIRAAEEEMRLINPSLVDQEIYGKFVAGDLQIFKNIDKCHIDIPHEHLIPRPGAFYSIGIDLAIMRDETAIVVVDMYDYTIMHVASFTKIGWDEQERQMKAVYDKFSCNGANSPIVTMDTTIESMVADDLERKYCIPIDKVRITKANKGEMITKLATFTARCLLRIPKTADGGKVVAQLNTFERIFTDTGYGKMKGHGRMPDDVVMALALALKPLEIDYSDKQQQPMQAEGYATDGY